MWGVQVTIDAIPRICGTDMQRSGPAYTQTYSHVGVQVFVDAWLPAGYTTYMYSPWHAHSGNAEVKLLLA